MAVGVVVPLAEAVVVSVAPLVAEVALVGGEAAVVVVVVASAAAAASTQGRQTTLLS